MDLHETESRTQQVVSNDSGDDDYIHMDVNLSSSSSSPSSHQLRRHLFSTVASGEPTTSPADELFYKVQLLPLHLPPRLKMVQKLLASSSSSVAASATNTPVSPRAAVSSPRRFSSSEIEISGQDEQCYFEISTELKRFIENNENLGNSWSKKIKHSSITQKLKASRAYIRGLFTKPGCSDSSEIQSKFKTENIKTSKSSKIKNPFEKTESANNNNPQLMIHKISFSGVIQRQHSPAKCSSSSSSSSSSASSLSSSLSFGSNGSLDLQTLMRSSNASSEIDNSIECCPNIRKKKSENHMKDASKSGIKNCFAEV